jgi:hypothetical protein
MTTSDTNNGPTRDDLLQRIELMETMIAEGRRFTARCGWIFVLWGLINIAAMTWLHIQRNSDWVGKWAWPVCLGTGVLLTFVGSALQKRRPGLGKNMQCRTVEAVWGMMGIALTILVTGAMVAHLTWEFSYVSGVLVVIGMAHAVSAIVLRWRVQGMVAALWWVGGFAVFFSRGSRDVTLIMFVEMCLGMVLFGLYAMMLERRESGAAGNHA